MRPAPGEVLHFSEDPTITEFVPHVAGTAQVPTPYVWAVDADLAPSYWFPRQCPRAMAWRLATSTASDLVRILGPGGGDRVHAIEPAWVARMLDARVFAYRLPAARFRFIGHAWVSEEPVTPIGPPVPVGNLVTLHGEAGIQLRVLPELWPFWDAVRDSTLGFSGIRLHNARPR